ncbi:hypothetical protein XFF6166_150004 [Xanthomonas citri pv. fuscans]|nr:hypothetical protein XFF6166_150004 [Xanthomonas citri pv. fuscans]
MGQRARDRENGYHHRQHGQAGPLCRRASVATVGAFLAASSAVLPFVHLSRLDPTKPWGLFISSVIFSCPLDSL